jgi:ATP-dependent Clp protease protease subunit
VHISVTGPDPLTERLLERRIVRLTGRIDTDAANDAAGALALLDADGDDPVQLWLCDVDADLEVTLTLLDVLDLMGVEIHAICLGELVGAGVALLTAADRRDSGVHTVFHLREPRTRYSGYAADAAAYTERQQRHLQTLHERLAHICGRSVDEIAADMRNQRILTAEQARDYGLIDTVTESTPGP